VVEFQMLLEYFSDALGIKISPLVEKAKEFVLDKNNNLISFNRPLGVQLEITSLCNLKCVHCYNNSSSNPKSYNEELSEELWLKIAKELKAMGVFTVIISGGEPLLKRSLVEKILTVFAENKNIAIGIITNGWFVDDSFIDFLKSLPNQKKWVQVSVDGATPQEHDWVRGVTGSWERAVEAVYKIANAGILVKVAHTCNKKNYKNIWKMVELAIFLGAKEFIFTPVLEAGRGFLNRDLLILSENEKEELDALGKSLIKQYNSLIKIIRGAEYPAYYSKFIFIPTCAALIRPDGKVKLDCSVPVVFGDLKEETFSNIWNKRLKYGWQNKIVLDFVKNYTENKTRNIPYVSDDILAY